LYGRNDFRLPILTDTGLPLGSPFLISLQGSHLKCWSASWGQWINSCLRIGSDSDVRSACPFTLADNLDLEMPTGRDNIGSEARAFVRFLLGIPGFVRQRMSYDEARAIVLQRLRGREKNFLASIEHGVFGNPRSPYRAMLDLAGCEFGDLVGSVRKTGMEETLRELHREGVYVTFEEFKGRQPIVRGGREIPAGPGAFDNRDHRRYFSVTTGGSSGAGRRVTMDLTHLKARLPHRVLSQHFAGAEGLPAASWSDLPPAGGLTGMLMSGPIRGTPHKWFSATGRDGISLRFRLATDVALSVARLSGARVNWPVYLPFDQAVVLAQWARDRIKESGGCVISGSVSRILRVAVAAQEAGIDLTGAILRGHGEPPTHAKVAQITRTGGKFYSGYAYTEVGSVGTCCLNSDQPNDQHFYRDHLAMIQAPRQVPGFEIEVSAFCFTTLLSTAPKLLINVESDDYGTVDTKPCGCPWEELGLPEHLREIRSFRKLTGEGVTLVGSDMERILEEVLPARFGGSALDYQLLEEEDDKGFTRITLLVAPAVSLPDEAAAVNVVLEALHQIGANGDSSRNIWRQAGTIRVRREAPRLTSRGKLMPLQLVKHARPAAAGADRA